MISGLHSFARITFEPPIKLPVDCIFQIGVLSPFFRAEEDANSLVVTRDPGARLRGCSPGCSPSGCIQ
jgi:hypothetical protein